MFKLIQKQNKFYFTAALAALFLFPVLANAQYYPGYQLISPQNPAPSVYSYQATEITKDSAVLSASINPNGAHAYVWFNYGVNSASLSQIIGYQSIGPNQTNFSVKLTNILPSTTYYFRIVAQSPYGTVTGDIYNFKTLGFLAGNAPIVITEPVLSISQNTAVLKGTVNPNYSSTVAWFEYGITRSLGYTTAYQNFNNSGENQTASVYLSGLQENTTYYFRLVAQNYFGTVLGDIFSFTNQAAVYGGFVAPSAPSYQTLPQIPASGQDARGIIKSSDSTPFFPSLSLLPRKKIEIPKIVSEFVTLDVDTDVKKPVAGGEIIYTFNYKNEGDYPARDSVIKAVLPKNTEYISSVPTPFSKTGNNLSFDLGNIKPGESGTIVVKAKITALVGAGDALVASGVLNYKDNENVFHSVNGYLASIIYKRASATASLLGIFDVLVGNWFFDFILGLIFGYGVYKFFMKSKETDLAG